MPTTLIEIVVDLMARLPSLSATMPAGLPELSQRLGVLPLTWDMGGCRAIRPTGEIVSWPWDQEDKLSIESTQLERNRAMFQGAVKYPALQAFLPTRPSDAETCGHCGGTGKVSGFPEAYAGQFVCFCGGAGWLPASEVGV